MVNGHADARAANFLDSWLEFQARERGLPGFSVGVWRGKQPIFTRSYGLANLASHEPLTLAHRINIGSQAKMFTATAIMQLAEAGKLVLDDPVVRFLPWLRAHHDPQMQHVTIRELLWHGAGLVRDGSAADFWQLRQDFPGPQTFRQMILESTIVIEPGVKLKYSNLGYALLGEVITAVSDQPYESYVTEHILQPLGMRHTVPSDIQPELQATGYTQPIEGERLEIPRHLPAQALAPATGWLSTIHDMGIFMAAQLPSDERMLSKASMLELHTDRRSHWQTKALRGSKHGLGFFVHEFGDRRVVGYSGGFLGYRSASHVDLVDKLSVVVFGLSKDTPVMQMSHGIFGVFDFFAANANKQTRPERAQFNARLMSLWSTLEIVATNRQIVAIYPEDWQPFANIAEELMMVDADSLRIMRAHDIHPIAEKIIFHFRGNNIQSVDYADTTMLSEANFRSWLKNNWLYS